MFDITNKNILITGATGGIGKAAALKTFFTWSKHIFVARKSTKAKLLVGDEISEISDKEAVPIIADLSSQADIHSVAQVFNSFNIPLHVLLNNAGLINKERKTVDGLEEVLR